MAESRIVPFMERLITPARSERVSPNTAKIMGEAAASTPARPIRRVSWVICASCLLHEFLPCAIHQEDEEHQHTLQHTRQRRIQFHDDGQLNTANVQRGKE